MDKNEPNLTQQLSPRQRAALAVLATSGNVTDAAAAARVSRETLYTWMRLEHFKQAMGDLQTESLDNLSRRLVSLGDQAANALAEVMAGETPPAAKIRAAEVVLSNLLKLRELVDLTRRVEELEKARQ